MMVSFIQSNYMGFGSGVVEPEYGISLQNRGHGFSLQAGSPNQVAPGKRPFHTIIPAFLTKDGQPVMSYGVMGGDMQPQGHMQTLVRMLDYGQNPQAACDAPRWRYNLQRRSERRSRHARRHGAGPARPAATRWTRSTTATRTSAPASSSGGSTKARAMRRRSVTPPPATRGVMASRPGSEALPSAASR